MLLKLVNPFDRNFAKPLLRSLLASAGLALLAAHSSAPAVAQTPEIAVVQVMDRGGINADLSRDYFVGAKLWFDQVNTDGGVAGRKIRFTTRDTQGSALELEAAAVAVATKREADVLFGMVSDDAVARLAANAGFRSSGVPLFAPISGFDYSGADTNVFAVRANYGTEIKKMLDYASTLGLTRMSLLLAKDESTAKMRSLFTQAVSARGLNLGAIVELDAEASDAQINAAVTRLTRSTAQAGLIQTSHATQTIMIAGDAVLLGRFAMAVRRVSTGILLIGTSQVNHRAIMEIAPRAMVGGMMLTQVVPAPNQGNSRLVRDYLSLLRARLDEPPSHASLEGFIAARALTETLRSSRARNSADITQALRAADRIDLDGVVVHFNNRTAAGVNAVTGVANGRARVGNFTDLALVRANGSVVQ
jgi:branched-chain amino acid transport system substrate-binding protein